MFGGDDEIAYIMPRVEDVTKFVALKPIIGRVHCASK
jgi:hypothetical protein